MYGLITTAGVLLVKSDEPAVQLADKRWLMGGAEWGVWLNDGVPLTEVDNVPDDVTPLKHMLDGDEWVENPDYIESEENGNERT